jgi:hypothetical protein
MGSTNKANKLKQRRLWEDRETQVCSLLQKQSLGQIFTLPLPPADKTPFFGTLQMAACLLQCKAVASTRVLGEVRKECHCAANAKVANGMGMDQLTEDLATAEPMLCLVSGMLWGSQVEPRCSSPCGLLKPDSESGVAPLRSAACFSGSVHPHVCRAPLT